MTAGFLQRERIVAKPGWTRWMVPPAALAVHLSVGAAYGWSVMKPGLEAGLGLTGVQSALPFTVAFAMLGISAAFFGTKVDTNGPRWAMVVSTSCFVAGWLISALGLFLRQYWMVILGFGFVGGIGLGVGYISPVSTLMKWFPDRPGLATGIAIMGFGGGALIISAIAPILLNTFGAGADELKQLKGLTPAARATAEGIAQTDHFVNGMALTFFALGLNYLLAMTLGWLLIRVPRPDYMPAGWDPSMVKTRGGMITTAHVSRNNAIKTPQFWLLWIVLCFNVSAGIGIIEKAAPIFTDFFGKPGSDPTSLAAAAAAFVAILSLANCLGRIGWSTLSDKVGRKNMYRMYLGGGALLYAAVLLLGNSNKALFLVCALLILSYYGAGFATVPAYLKDLFGTYQVGAIHGVLLTAWSTAGILGPLILNGFADKAIEAGVEGPARYTTGFCVVIGLLIIGFIANELIRPVNPKWHEPEHVTKKLVPTAGDH